MKQGSAPDRRRGDGGNGPLIAHDHVLAAVSTRRLHFGIEHRMVTISHARAADVPEVSRRILEGHLGVEAARIRSRALGTGREA